MTAWIDVAALADVPDGRAHEVVAAGRIVALFNVEGTIYAIDGICPHQGGSLGKGSLDGCVVTCPWHGFQFDVTTGKHPASPQLVQQCFPVKVENDRILVAVEQA